MPKFILLLLILLGVRLLIFIVFPPPVIIQKNPIRETTIFTQIKDHIRQVYSQNLSGQQSALLMGIVFGDKGVDRESLKTYQQTGVLHVIAASGMNVSMLTSFLLAGLLVFFRRQQALILTFFAIIFYTALADFQPSIVRAAIMAGAALGAGVLGRQNTSLLALFFAAFAMVFWDPAVLVSISFILSFAATLGIILLDPLFKNFLKGEIFEDFRTTLAAQIATTPIILFFFGTYSPASVPVNFLVLWTVPPLMLLGGIAAILSFIPILAAPFVLLCLPLLDYFNGVVDFFARYSVQINLKTIPWTAVFGYYLISLALIIWLRKKVHARV